MQIFIKTKKLAKILNSEQKLIKKYGKSSAKKIMQRLDDMQNAESLEELMNLPGRHHQLKGNKKGLFACDLEHPLRLIYKPATEPLPVNENNVIIYSEVTEIEILSIEDYH